MYGECSVVALEPIEKRPLFHYDMGGKYLSVGFYGCSFRCDFCQNYTVSQTTKGKKKRLSPKELIDLAKKKKANGIAFTYNEPTVYYEYIMDVATTDVDMPIVIKTNGFANQWVIKDLARVTKAWNVDIKGDDEEYDKVCGGSLKPVLDTIAELYNLDQHLEISYLVTPRLLRDDAFQDRLLSWLTEIPAVPLHFLYFYPFHRMTEQSYGVHELLPLIDKFKEIMHYVYVSNAYNSAVSKYRNTNCPTCGKLMVDRYRKTKIYSEVCCGHFIKGLPNLGTVNWGCLE